MASSDWNNPIHTFSPWKYRIVAAYPESDIDGLTHSSDVAISIIGLLMTQQYPSISALVLCRVWEKVSEKRSRLFRFGCV